jgi:pyruvate kinase
MDKYTDHLSDLASQVKSTLLELGYVDPCDLIVITGGHPLTARGSTNFLKVMQINEGEQMAESGPMGYADD